MKRTFLFLCALPLAGSLVAGEIVVSDISEKQQPFKRMNLDTSEKNLVKMYGEAQGKQMAAYYAEMIKKDPQSYSVTVANTDKLRKATSVELLLEFFDRSKKLGEKVSPFNVEIGPGKSESLLVDCDQYAPYCRPSQRLSATVKNVKWVELKFGSPDEMTFEWKGTRWYLENHWNTEKVLTLRSYSGSYYTDKGFDGKVFPAGKWEAEETRFYRVAKEPIPTGFAEDPDAYEMDVYRHLLLPGHIVENGKTKGPRFLDTFISNIKVEGKIAVGEYVQMKEILYDKQTLEIVVAPVCQSGPRHRRLRSRVRFVLGAEVMKGPDYEAIDAAIRPWLEPVSIGTVARTCGPKSGNLVRKWDANTTIDQIEDTLGPAEARSEVKGGEVLAYGAVRMKFVDGKLAGVEKKAPR